MADNDDSNAKKEFEKWLKHPLLWFKQYFPELFTKYGGKVADVIPRKDGVYYVHQLNEDFLAETLGQLGNPKSPTIYVGREDRFYRYEPKSGIFMPVSESQLLAELSSLLQRCAEECEQKGFCDTTSLRFTLCKSTQLRGVIIKARGLLRVPETYFDASVEDYLACKNGMLRLSDMQLMEFSPDYRRRNKLSVAYDPNAQCPLFLDTLMRQALDDDDMAFLQKWFGLALLGKNKPNIIVILVGTAGSGKSTFVKVVTDIIGKENVHTLRTERLGDKFETSFYLGKTLLHGVDVNSEFLTQKSASVLKALTGGDVMNVELKNGREAGPEIEGYFNVIIICNSLPNIRLEGDVKAWQRRLMIVEYKKPKPSIVNCSLADDIRKGEGSGVLNWALIGLKQLRDAGWKFTLTPCQNDLVNKVLYQSDSPRQFVRNCLVQEKECSLKLDDCFERYVSYCKELGWKPLQYTKAMPIIDDEIMRQFGLNQRHDIPDKHDKGQRGWKGLKVK